MTPEAKWESKIRKEVQRVLHEYVHESPWVVRGAYAEQVGAS